MARSALSSVRRAWLVREASEWTACTRCGAAVRVLDTDADDGVCFPCWEARRYSHRRYVLQPRELVTWAEELQREP